MTETQQAQKQAAINVVESLELVRSTYTMIRVREASQPHEMAAPSQVAIHALLPWTR